MNACNIYAPLNGTKIILVMFEFRVPYSERYLFNAIRDIIIIIIIMEKTEAGHQWPLYPRNTFGIITLNYIQLY